MGRAFCLPRRETLPIVAEIEKEVNEASSFIRGKLAGLIDARSIPFLEFTYDESIEYGNKIENIIKKIHEKDNKDSLD